MTKKVNVEVTAPITSGPFGAREVGARLSIEEGLAQRLSAPAVGLVKKVGGRVASAEPDAAAGEGEE